MSTDAQDAARWREIARRYDEAKTSACQAVLDSLKLRGDPTEPLAVVVEAALTAAWQQRVRMGTVDK